MGLRIIKNNGRAEELEEKAAQWEALLAKEADRWGEWQNGSVDGIRHEFSDKVRKARLRHPRAEDYLLDAEQVESAIKHLAKPSGIHKSKKIDTKKLLELL